MSTLVVPPLDREPWPSLGGQVAAFIEEYLVHGPGDLRGQPARLDDEKRALLWRFYELFPASHPDAGRRRFKRCAISLRKGSAKTEFAAWIAAVELHPDGPVRCVGWDEHGNPIGGPVTDPYIPLVAYTEEQSEELAYGALRVILELSEVADAFDIGLERIMRKRGDGKAVALATAPDSRDGARTTFQIFDETHRFVLPRLREAHRTMLANTPKRKLADAWSLEITTAPAPGENSVAEQTMEYARQVAAGKLSDSRLFFFHREAGEHHKLDTPEDVRAAVLEASGPVAEWSDIDAIVELRRDPTTDQTYWERVWLNRLVRSSERAFDAERWKQLVQPDYVVADKALITLGFDGSRYKDATALIGTEVATGYQWPIGIWQRPPRIDDWEVPVHEVDEAVAGAFQRWTVWRLYADPPYWDGQIAAWSGKYGAERVVEWWTNRQRQMGYAVRAYANAIKAGEVTNSGDRLFTEHIGNTVRRELTIRDDEGKPLFTVQKERPDSPHKIDGAVAAVIAWEARNDAIAAGVLSKQEAWSFGAV